MTKLGDTAKVRVSGSHVNHRSPIEDQVIEVYRAAKRYADANKFKMHIHNGPYGAVRGVAGPMILKRLVKQLFPEYTDDEFNTAYSIINQALRKTDAAVCLKRPRPHADDPNRHDPNDMPVWFIRDQQPGNLVVVTLAQAKRSADVTSRPTGFNEQEFLTPRERRLDKHSVGEDLPPGEVTVSMKSKSADDRRAEALAAQREATASEHQVFVGRVLEEIATSPVPIAPMEIAKLVNEDMDWSFHKSTYRDAIRELVEAGQVVGRQETADEALVRGGGRPPRATRPHLYWPAPGPVPTRTSLPPGIEPSPSAQDLTAQSREELERDRGRALEYIQTHKRDERRVTYIANALEITVPRAYRVLGSLIDDGTIYENQGRYYHVKSKQVRSTKTAATEAPKSLPSEPPMDTVQTVPSPPAGTHGDDDGDLALVQRLAAKLGVELPRGDERRVAELETQVQLLNEETATLKTENDRLKSQVETLKAAINALT